MNSRYPTPTPLRTAIQLAIPASAALAAGHASAQIVYTPVEQTVSKDSGQKLYVDMGDGLGGAGSLSFSSSDEADFQLFFSAANEIKVEVVVMDASRTDLAQETVGPGSLIDTTVPLVSSLFLLPGADRSFVGVYFSDADDERHFGWIEVSSTAADGDLAAFFTVHGVAYEQQPDVGIFAGGEIPEPSTTALVAALVAGSAVAYQRRRKQKAGAEVVAE